MIEASEPDALKSPPTRLTTFGNRWKFLGVAIAAFALLFGATIPASAAELMRVTFVRHGESAGNASGLIDTSTPGPALTAKGQQQAEAVVGKLGVNNYDAIYASTMVRTQLTAAPMSQYLHLPIVVLPGLQEVEAGVFEGTPESGAANGYAQFPLAWALQGNLDLRIPGSIDGHEFDARMDGALKTIYDNGDRNPIVFSHGAAIMFWTMINAQNLTLTQKVTLLRTAPLGNTDYVVVEGNPEDGWTLTNWNGQLFSPEPTLGAEVKLQVRTLVRQLAANAKLVSAAFATLSPAKILAAISQGAADASYSVAKFTGAVSAKLVHELGKLGTADTATQTVQNVSTSRAAGPTEATVTASPADTNSLTAAKTAAMTTGNTVTVHRTPIAASTNEPANPKQTAAAKPNVTTNGATDLKDGNKAAPGTTAAEKKADPSGEDETVGTKTTASTEGDAASTAGSGAAPDGGEAGAQQRDAA